MVEMIYLNSDLPEGFYKYLTEDGLALIRTGQCAALGLVEDDLPIGAVVADPGFNGVGEIVSLYIDPEKRRKGYATELVAEATNMLYSFDNMYAIGTTFSEIKGEDSGLKEFFEYLEFDLEEDSLHGTYSFKLADIAASDKVKGDIDKRVTPMKDVLSATKNTLVGRLVAVQSFLMYGEIDEEVSCVVNDPSKDPKDLSCLFIGKSNDDLVITWAQAAENSLDLINMLRFAIVTALKKYGKDINIRVPYINENSKKVIEKLLVDKAIPVEKVWNAYLPLDWEEGEETEEEVSDDFEDLSSTLFKFLEVKA